MSRRQSIFVLFPYHFHTRWYENGTKIIWKWYENSTKIYFRTILVPVVVLIGMLDSRRPVGMLDSRRPDGMLDSRRPDGMLDSRRLAGMLDSRRPDGILSLVLPNRHIRGTFV